MRSLNWLRGFSYFAMAVVALLAFGVSNARADVIFIDTFFLPDPLGDPSSEAAFIEDEVGLPLGSLTYLFKTGAVDGALGDGDPEITVDGVNTNTGTISWDLTGTGFEMTYILLKDGSCNANQPQPNCDGNTGHLYTLYGVTADQTMTSDGDQTVQFVGLDEDPLFYNKGISHITFFGTEQTQVPEPTSLLLLGSGLAGLALLKRRK